MRILAINPGHNGSCAYLVDGELEFYIEEERLSRSKYDGNPFRGIIEALRTGIDILVLGGTNPQMPSLFWTGEDPYSAIVRKYNPNVQVINLAHEHHKGHAATAFYNSGFETAAAVVVDGAGSVVQFSIDEQGENNVGGFETESVYHCSYPSNFELVWKSAAGNSGTIPARLESNQLLIDDSVTITKAYEAVSHYLGFGFIEAGKTMGLAPYGKENDNIPEIFINGRGNRNLLRTQYPAGAVINDSQYDYLRLTADPKEWHNDHTKVTEAAKDLAYKVQQETQKLVGDIVESAHDSTGETNIVISGGFGLNCMANYYLQKRFPNLNIYFEAVSHDGGTAIGLARMVYHTINEDSSIRPLNTLYLGPSLPDYSVLDEEHNFTTRKVTKKEVAELIAEKNIVTIFQGRSEAGPRALGNRSILYDPRDENGKQYVNTVKGREWFRPFAGSMLVEHFNEWFETAGLEESPFMMHAIDFKNNKHGEVPAITHVDGTCRIQTVNENQNKNFYELIQEFYKVTGVPILFNTSFNLAGEPLVETLEDALSSCFKSSIRYLYLPEIDILVECDKNKE